MKKLLMLTALALTMAARAADTPAAVPPLAPGSMLAPLASLVGGVWVADIPVPQGAAPLTIELRFEWTENHQAIRFDSAFMTKDGRKPYTSGLYTWDGAKKTLLIFYVNNVGDVTQGTITPEGDTLVNDLVASEPGGISYPVKVRLKKIGNDTFENAIFLMKNNEWAPFLAVKYVRQK